MKTYAGRSTQGTYLVRGHVTSTFIGVGRVRHQSLHIVDVDQETYELGLQEAVEKNIEGKQLGFARETVNRVWVSPNLSQHLGPSEHPASLPLILLLSLRLGSTIFASGIGFPVEAYILWEHDIATS